jgi:hypothetical protein
MGGGWNNGYIVMINGKDTPNNVKLINVFWLSYMCLDHTSFNDLVHRRHRKDTFGSCAPNLRAVTYVEL